MIITVFHLIFLFFNTIYSFCVGSKVTSLLPFLLTFSHFIFYQVSLTDTDGNFYKDFLFEREMKQHRPLKLKKKLSEFYTAPITKFWADSVTFLCNLYFPLYYFENFLDGICLLFGSLYLHSIGTNGSNAKLAGAVRDIVYYDTRL